MDGVEVEENINDFIDVQELELANKANSSDD